MKEHLMRHHGILIASVVLAAVVGFGVGLLTPLRASSGDEDPRLYTVFFETQEIGQPGGPTGMFVQSEVSSAESTDHSIEVSVDAQAPDGPVQPDVGRSSLGPYDDYSGIRGGGAGLMVDNYPSGTVFTAHFQIKDAQENVVATRSLSITKP